MTRWVVRTARIPRPRYLPGLLLVAMASLAGCGGDGVRDPVGGMMSEPTTSFREVQETVFTPSCALTPGCHAGAGPAMDMDLSEGNAYRSIVGVPSVERTDLLRVAPGNPDASYLYKKIVGAPDIVFSQMPLVGGPLDAERTDLVRRWIEEGALDN